MREPTIAYWPGRIPSGVVRSWSVLTMLASRPLTLSPLRATQSWVPLNSFVGLCLTQSWVPLNSFVGLCLTQSRVPLNSFVGLCPTQSWVPLNSFVGLHLIQSWGTETHFIKLVLEVLKPCIPMKEGR